MSQTKTHAELSLPFWGTIVTPWHSAAHTRKDQTMNPEKLLRNINSICCGSFGCRRNRQLFSQKGTIMNPETLLNQVETAIKHRTISDTHRWHLVYYYDRFCCVPSPVNVPPEIILGEFTEIMVQRGFTSQEWDQLKDRAAKLYKELHK